MIERLLAQARSGLSGVLVVRGKPGVEKSALLEHAAGTADGFTVLRGVGIESEAELAFAGLHQVIRPVLDRLDRLPAPQASALRSAFALSEEPIGERFPVSLGVLGSCRRWPRSSRCCASWTMRSGLIKRPRIPWCSRRGA